MESAATAAIQNTDERRKKIRYQVEVPVTFSWQVSRRDRLNGQGTTKDISVASMYVYCPMCPPVGAKV